LAEGGFPAYPIRMALLLSCSGLTKQFGATILFRDVSFTVEEGERLGLIGPNGAGKSTLLKILSGLDDADKGDVALRKGVKIASVVQDPVFDDGVTVASLLPTSNIWYGRAGFENPNAVVNTLSGGWRKRLAIAIGAAAEPDLLFLDEPTNHLDLEGIIWLEKALKAAPFASVVISHDRYFLENVATHVAELNSVYPNGTFRVEGNYSKFLERREQYFEAERRRKEGLEVVVRRELEWLSRGAKARTRKSKARIGTANEKIAELKDMDERSRVSSVSVDFSASGRQTKRLIEAEKISKSLGGKKLFSDIDLALVPGMKLGIAGANGSGKSTMLRLLQGLIPPDSGEVRRAENLKLVYFDQQREQLDPTWTLRRALAPDGDSVIFQDRVIHVNAWAKMFLFETEQLQQTLGRLSGGERARVLIARLMLQPADVLMLDEPTNDLDIPTLGVLEDSLLEFNGALILVTHDRYLLDRVSTHILGLNGAGNAVLYADYSQYEEDLANQKREAKAAAPKVEPVKAELSAKKKLSYMEQREYDGIEAAIHAAEEVRAAKEAESQSPDVVSDHKRIEAVYAELSAAEKEVERLYMRWSELEEKLR
jgi:ABC transport system ATP-binding/permease protein